AGQGAFVPIPDKPIGPQGEDSRSIRSWARMEVRLTARDFAKNLAEQTIIVGGGVTTGLGNEPAPRDPGGMGAAGTVPGRPRTNHINSKKVVLEFRVTEKGLSGIKAAELWNTRNGRD